MQRSYFCLVAFSKLRVPTFWISRLTVCHSEMDILDTPTHPSAQLSVSCSTSTSSFALKCLKGSLSWSQKKKIPYVTSGKVSPETHQIRCL